MSKEIYHIAIDGPVASGKGTIARLLSLRLEIPCLDTGAMYRAFGVYILEKGIDENDEVAVTIAVGDVNIETKIIDNITRVSVNGIDVTDKIRDNTISRVASNVSRYPAVRAKLVGLQQDIAKTQSFILEGRDIGSVVLPNAKFKFYLTADLITRGNRRLNDLKAKGVEITFNEVVRQIKQRDKIDMHKKVGALKRVPDAVVIDNTKLTHEETVEIFYRIITINK